MTTQKHRPLLDVAGKWSILICTGWNGRGQAARRLGAGAGFDLMHRAAAVLHGAILMDAKGNRLPIAQVEGLGVETDSALDLANLWVGSIAVNVELPLELLPSRGLLRAARRILADGRDVRYPGRP